MATEQDLQTSLDTISTAVSAVAGRVQSQADQIVALQAQVGAGTPVTQEQLDALVTEANDIASALAPLVPPVPQG